MLRVSAASEETLFYFFRCECPGALGWPVLGRRQAELLKVECEDCQSRVSIDVKDE